MDPLRSREAYLERMAACQNPLMKAAFAKAVGQQLKLAEDIPLAVDLAKSISDPDGETSQAIFRRLATDHPSAVWEATSQLPDPSRLGARKLVIVALGRRGYAAAADFLSNQPASSERSALGYRLLQDWLPREPEVASAWADRNGDTDMWDLIVGYALSRGDKDGAQKWQEKINNLRSNQRNGP